MLIGYIMKIERNINAPKANAIIPQGVTDKPFAVGVLYFLSWKK